MIFEVKFLNRIIYEKGNYIKKYINGDLKFEGDNNYGKRNGKGKEYKYDELNFEVEYLNGKIYD